jgi:hypothetical protein
VRPEELEQLLVNAINEDERLTAGTYAEVGVTRSRYGLAMATDTGVSAMVQIVSRLAPGERHDTPAAEIMGDPHRVLDVPDPVVNDAFNWPRLERFLAGLIVQAAAAAVDKIDIYSARKKPNAIPFGLTVAWHNGATSFLYILRRPAKKSRPKTGVPAG